MYDVRKRDYLGSYYIATTETECQSKQVTNALNKMAIGEYFYQEVSE